MEAEIRSHATQDSALHKRCVHCDNILTSPLMSRFCCRGCEAVYTILNERGLQHYYTLRKSGDPRKPLPPPPLQSSETYTYLDEPDFIQLYAWESPSFPGDKMMEFYLEGVHCAACIWLTEKISEFIAGVTLVRLNLSDSVATVKISPEGSFAQVAQEFLNLGYRPHPVNRTEGKSARLKQKENRLLLIQLGVAGACSGNIMLMAFSLYAGATGGFAQQFKWISFLLYLPVITFSAAPFHKSAWVALRGRRASIDIPVLFGLLIGSVVSTANLFHGSDEIYFDSLSALIFLLLSTRYLLKKTQQSALNSSHLLYFLTPSHAKKLNTSSGEFQTVKLDQIQPGDLIQVNAGESIPVDGFVKHGHSSISQSLLTGESRAERIEESDPVFAGTVNLESPLEIQVTHSGSTTRLGKILNLMDEVLQKKAPLITFADQVSQYFVLAVVVLSAGTFLLGLNQNWQDGLNRALAIALVTCPCAFALATPLAFSVALGRLAKAGVLVKGSEVLEKLCQIKSIFLDKTGTLTYGNLRVLAWISHESSEEMKRTQAIAYHLESKSNHPIAHAVTQYLEPVNSHTPIRIENFSETLGKGVSGKVEGALYEIGQETEKDSSTQIAILRNGRKIASIQMGDEIREESKQAIQQLRSLKLNPWILSGDHRSAVLSVGEKIGISPDQCIAEASPEKKNEIVQLHPQSLMVGDGANDSVALASAYVGIAVHSGVEISMKAADIYLCHPGLQPLNHLIIIARETMKVIYRNFAFSIAYNILVGIAALLGMITPLFAAVLMPLSSLTVFLSSMAGTKKMRKALLDLNL